MSTLCDLTKQYAPLVGRILLAILFLKSGIGKITGFSETAAFMASKGMPMAEVLLLGAIVFEIAGGVMLILGWKVHWGALMLIVFTIPATLIFHNFWAVDPAQVANQTNHFLKNLSIIGGLSFIMGMGAGPLSLDNRGRS